jgi:hypothetical protein
METAFRGITQAVNNLELKRKELEKLADGLDDMEYFLISFHNVTRRVLAEVISRDLPH